VISPQSFSLEGSARRQLRRQIRKAERSGIETRQIVKPDWSELHAIHQEWEAGHGAERGLTMGRFCPLFLKDKPLFGAYLNDQLVGYISGVCGRTSISLDLMRHKADLPAGTMHALVCEMIAFAKTNDLDEVNLAAVPHPALTKRFKICAGLTRFKSSFGPSWRPLYMAAPNRLTLGLTALDLWFNIRKPAPIKRSTADTWTAEAMISGETAHLPQSASLKRTG
jgi:phosphatidylglycerol lysyltransferase